MSPLQKRGAKQPLPALAETSGKHTRRLIADVVHEVISLAFPDKYPNLCHAYAVVGSSLASVVCERDYRPAAGLAIIDAGGGHFLALTNNTSFANPTGGNYHCWILSRDTHPRDTELIDFTFRNNKAYADAHGIPWTKRFRSFVWGLEREVNIGGEPLPTPAYYDDGRAWFRETDEGAAWMAREVAANMDAYAKLTAVALRYYKGLAERTMASGSARLPLVPAASGASLYSSGPKHTL